MAQAESRDNTGTNAYLRPIEGNSRWTGTLAFNIVDLNNEAELSAFNRESQLSAQSEGTEFKPMVQDFPSFWRDEIAVAVSLLRDIINLDIVLTNDINADYLIGEEQGGLGVADFPANYPDGSGRGRAFVGFNIGAESHLAQPEAGGGSDRFQTIIHEFGHTLGLGHPHDDGAGTTLAPGLQPGGDGFSNSAPYLQSQTMMSYTAPPGIGDQDYGFGRSVTPMALDIAALQNIYGANTSTRTGDTIYRLTDAGTAALDLDSSDGTISIGRAYYGIWDAGTSDTDTIVYDGGGNVLINLLAATLTGSPDAEVTEIISALQGTGRFNELNEATRAELTDANISAGGFFSSVLDSGGGRIQGGFSIAKGVIIENAAGGAGNDTLLGNAAANQLTGNGGNDLLIGGGGNDRLVGGGGDDIMIGGTGTDTAVFTGTRISYTVQQSGDDVSVQGGDGSDGLKGVEALQFDDTFVFFDDRRMSTDGAKTVAYVYEAGLNRNGAIDLGGLNFWIDKREQGLNEHDLSQAFLNSNEFRSAFGDPGTLGDREIVEVLYRNVLNREGEQGGVDFWVEVLSNPSYDRADLLLSFARSGENLEGSAFVGSLFEAQPGIWQFADEVA
ncbi:MAG: DUF4214 domain-containing protein [Rhizobiaceae bacterium]|nr:DUF4214 domain-containing protein [Rhizobiaceae bacterium]